MGGHHNGGPPPKRDEERRRRNERPIATVKVDVADLIKQDREIPVPDEEWHPVAREWFVSLRYSGQAIYYEGSDWMTAYLLAEEMSRELKPKPFITTDPGTGEQYVEWHQAPMPGAKLNGFLKGFASLMATEADRRRLSLEIERNKNEIPEGELPDGVASIFAKRHAALES